MQVVAGQEDSDDEFNVHGIHYDVFELDLLKKGWFTEAKLNGRSVICQVDTGAQVSVIDVSTLKRIGVKRIKTTQVKLTAYGGSS